MFTRCLAHGGHQFAGSVRSVILLVMLGPWSHLERCLLVMVATSSWVEEFLERYQTQGLGMFDDLEADWGIRRPTQDGQVFVYRAFDLWS